MKKNLVVIIALCSISTASAETVPDGVKLSGLSGISGKIPGNIGDTGKLSPDISQFMGALREIPKLKAVSAENLEDLTVGDVIEDLKTISHTLPFKPDALANKIAQEAELMLRKKLEELVPIPSAIKSSTILKNFKIILDEMVEEYGAQLKKDISNLSIKELTSKDLIKNLIAQLNLDSKPALVALGKALDILAIEPYAQKSASIATLRPNQFVLGEEQSNNARQAINNVALRSYIGSDALKNKKVMVALSGGGIRATLASAGFMCGLERLGILDTVETVTAISGGTWFLSTWIASGRTPCEFINLMKPVFANWSTENFKEALKSKKTSAVKEAINKEPLLKNPEQLAELAALTIAKFLSEEPLNWTDYYGAWLASHLLSLIEKQPQLFHIEQLQGGIHSGKYPYPVFQTIDALNKGKNIVEFSPDSFEQVNIGNKYIGRSAPIWSFGRRFIDRKTGPFLLGPVIPLGPMQGIWGSEPAQRDLKAYQELMDKLKPDLPGKSVVNKMINATKLPEEMLKEGKIPAAHINSILNGGPIDVMKIMDGGNSRGGFTGNNIPYFSAERRGPAVLFIVDSGNQTGAASFRGLFKAKEKIGYDQGLLEELGYRAGSLEVPEDEGEEEIKKRYEAYKEKNKIAPDTKLTDEQKITVLNKYMDDTNHKVIPRIDLDIVPVSYFKTQGGNGTVIIYVPLNKYDPRDKKPVRNIEYSDWSARDANHFDTMKFDRTSEEYNVNTQMLQWNLLKNANVIKEAFKAAEK